MLRSQARFRNARELELDWSRNRDSGAFVWSLNRAVVEQLSSASRTVNEGISSDANKLEARAAMMKVAKATGERKRGK
jgi:hypothetical protein